MPSKPIDEEKFGLTRMTMESILKLCKKNKLYSTPHLNDVLYLHFQGYTKIESLDEYTGLKCLWLESNALSELCGLDNQPALRCLFVHNNLIKKIENLEACRRLDTINCSNNYITTIENCGSDILPELTTLNIANNKIQSMIDFEQLSACLTLSVLDLSHNRIDDILIVGVLAKMPELRVLMLTGNPVVSLIPMYRKTMINECKQLTYLDSRPVFDRDRACAVAWRRGGYEEEKKEHSRWNRAEKKKIRDGVNATLALRIKKSLEKGEEPTVEMLERSDDEDDLEIEWQPSSKGAASKKSGGTGDGLYDEVDNGDPGQEELYEAYAYQVENSLLMEIEGDSDDLVKEDSEIGIEFNLETSLLKDEISISSKSDEKGDDAEKDNHNMANNPVYECGSNSSRKEVIPDTNSGVKEIVDSKIEDKTIVQELNRQIESDSLEPQMDFPKNSKGFTESDIHTKRKMIIEEIMLKPVIVQDDSDKINLSLDSNLITDVDTKSSSEPNIALVQDVTSLDKIEPDSAVQTSGSNKPEEMCLIEAIDSTDENSGDEFVDKNKAKQQRSIYESNTDGDSESDDHYSDNYDDFETLVDDIEKKTTVRGFLSDYMEFVETMQSKFKESKKFNIFADETKTESDSDAVQLQLPSNVDKDIDLDSIHNDFLVPINNDKYKTKSEGFNVERMLPRHKPILDLSLEEMDTELEVLEDNARNGLTDMVERIYRNREMYRTSESYGEECDRKSPEFIKNYYENCCGFKKNDKTESSSYVIDQLKGFDNETEKRRGVRFYCNNLSDYLENNADDSKERSNDTAEIIEEVFEEVNNIETEKQICSNINQAEKIVLNESYKLDSSKEANNACDSICLTEREKDDIEEVNEKPTNRSKSDEAVNIEFDIPVESISEANKINDIHVECTQEDIHVLSKISLSEQSNFCSPQCSNEPNDLATDASVANDTPDLEDEVARVVRLEFIQSLVFSAPKISDVVSDEPFFKEGEFGLDAEGARRAAEELRECPVYQNHIRRMKALDKELEENINRIMLDASIERNILRGLEQYGDPYGDNETDIYERAHRYFAEFKEQVNIAKNSKL